MENNEQTVLAQRLGRALSEQLGFPVGVDDAGGRITLFGTADSEAARADAEETVARLVPGMPIQNNLTVDPALRSPRTADYDDLDRPGDTRPGRGTTSAEATQGSDLDPGFADQPLETNASNVSDESVPDLDVPAEPDPTFFAPTDPVRGTDKQGGPQVIGGFTPDSTTSDVVDRSTTDGSLGDEAIADAVRRELHEDALTTDLPLDVVVERGVVHLRGRIGSLQDAEGAEEVAGRVPGVRDVVDETETAP